MKYIKDERQNSILETARSGYTKKNTINVAANHTKEKKIRTPLTAYNWG